MWVELHKLGIPMGESTVRMYVQERRKPSKPAYVPLDFAPGERAEFDFGEATMKLKGQLVKVPRLSGRLRFSGAMFVECFPTQRKARLPARPAPRLRVLGRSATYSRL
jgi:hypothetical protein